MAQWMNLNRNDGTGATESYGWLTAWLAGQQTK